MLLTTPRRCCRVRREPGSRGCRRRGTRVDQDRIHSTWPGGRSRTPAGRGAPVCTTADRFPAALPRGTMPSVREVGARATSPDRRSGARRPRSRYRDPRRRRDSNTRGADWAPNRFRGGPVRPLRHASADEFSGLATPPPEVTAIGVVRGSVHGQEPRAGPAVRRAFHREREQVARRADEIDLPSGSIWSVEGRLPHEFFVILDGEVEVTHDGQRLATLGPGDFFGEIALIEHGGAPRRW